MGTSYTQPATNILADTQEDENPFVGLRPYEAEESCLFFGRGKQITELLQKLYVTRFIGVVGSSGCGKSSLIKAGLIPKLKAGFLTNERDHWLTATMRPAGNPLLFLAEAICSELHASQFVPNDFLPEGNYSAALSKSIHEKGVQGVSDFLLPIFEKTSCNLLLVVDQFEELFTTKRENADAEIQMNENVLFVNMLLSLSRQKDLPVYVVITMRSDYIGSCNKFYGLPETLNEGQYLVPRLNRQQLNEVIELPIKLNGEKISARLLDQILNDSDKDLDQLPVLQHALMRTYKFWLQSKKTTPIDFADYEASGKLESALSNHANEVYGKLNTTQKKIAELIFKSLTDVNAENVPIRRRQSLEQLTKICQSIKDTSTEEVREVINKFRDRDCAFLTPFSGKLKESTIIDISHESLMRQWDRLKKWMNEEQGSAIKFKWLTDSVNNKREFLRGIDLNDALLWEANQPANEQWASRYKGSYNVVQNYIETSRIKARNNRYLKNVIIAIFIIVPLLGYSWYHHYDKKNVTTRNKMAKQYQDSIENKNVSLKNGVAKLKLSLEKQEKLQQELKNSFEKQQLMAKNQARSDLQAAIVKAETEAKERKRIQEQRNREEIDALKASLRQEPFYNSLNVENGNSINAEAIITALVDSYNKDKSEFNKLKQAITQVFQAKKIAQEDPETALRLSEKAWQNSKHLIIDSAIKKQIANKIYYKQQLVPFEENQFQDPSLFISGDKKSFAINDASNRIYTGIVSKDNLSMDDNFNFSYTNSFTPEDTLNNHYIPVKAFSIRGNSILALENAGKLSSWANNKKTEIGTIPGINKSKITEFSPDQQYVITAAGGNELTLKDSAVILWHIADLKQNAMPAKIILDSNNTRVKQISFSPNSRQCFILDNSAYSRYNLKIYNIGNIVPEFVSNVVAAQFTQEGNYIFTITRSGAMVVLDSIGRVTKFKPAGLESSDITKYLNQLRSISLSPDWKKIMFKQVGKISILEREDDDSIISINSSYQVHKLKLNSVYSSPDTTLLNTASFIDNNSILAVNNNGRILLWKTYPEFENIDEALKNIQLPDLTITEKLEDGSLTFNDIEPSENEHNLREAATYFDRKYNSSGDFSIKNNNPLFNYANKLYRKLLGKTSGEKKLYYTDKITILNRNFTDSRTADSAEQEKMVMRLNEDVELLENELKDYPENGALINRLSEDYNNLSFHLLFIKQYQKCIEACNKGLKLVPRNTIIYSNLALAYLLSGNFAEAEKIYSLYKDSSYESSGAVLGSFQDGFLQDFDDLTNAKVINEEKKDVYEKVQEMREMLGGVAAVKNNNQRFSIETGNKTIGTILGAVLGGSAGAIIGRDMDKQAKEIKNDIPGVKVERVEEGIEVEFNEKILFAFSKSEFGDSAKASLNNLVAVLNKYPNTNIEVQAHTDSRGSDEYNMGLSQRRAGTFADYLKAQGITASRITIKGYGESAPAYTNDTDEGMAQNRRVVFLITANDQMKENAKKQADQ